jgi:hypothetical protein
MLRAPLRVFGDGADREDRQHRIADELQHLAAVRQDGAGHALEVVVQQLEEDGAGQPVGESGRAAQVAQPDHRVDVLALAAMDQAVQNPLAGEVSEVGFQYDLGGPAQRVHLHQPGEHRQHLGDRPQLGGGEAARPIGGERHRVDAAVGEHHGQGGVVGGALGAQLLEDGEIQDGAGDVEAAANRACALEEQGVRALQEGVLLQNGQRRPELLDRVAVAQPAVAQPRELRVHGAQRQSQPHHRNAGRHHGPAEAARQGGQARDRPALVPQPLDQRIGRSQKRRCVRSRKIGDIHARLPRLPACRIPARSRRLYP